MGFDWLVVGSGEWRGERVGLGRCVGWMDEGRVALVRRGWGGGDVDVAKDWEKETSVLLSRGAVGL